MEKFISIYFEDNPTQDTLNLVNLFSDFFNNADNFCEYLEFKSSRPHPKEFGLNYSKLYSDSHPSIDMTLGLETLIHTPYTFLAIMHVSVHYVLSLNLPETLEKIRVYLSKFNKITPLLSIRSALIEKFVCISGNVVKVLMRKPLIKSVNFICSKCKSLNFQTLPEGKLIYPKYCSNPECHNTKLFQIDRKSAQVVDVQRIKIQENSNDEQSGVPLTIDCEAKDFKILDISVGDPVTVMGIVKAESSDLHKNKNTGLYGLYLDINSISSVKNLDSNCEEFTETEILQFEELSRTPNIFSILVQSFSSLIYGMEKIKAGLVLAILGGSENQGRNTSHVLIVGDPGLGKTQLLRTAVNYSLKGNYVSATTKAGLTFTISRETGQSLMRAGALVMADDGVCAIDEFDKMGKEQMAMLEVMEQQTITVAKSGIYCNLQARATIIAAANPVGGHYNPSKSLNDNIKINAAILSRFDLIFLLLDSHDSEVSKHVISMHNGKRNFSEAFRSKNLVIKKSATQNSNLTQAKNDLPNDEETYTEFLKRTKGNFSIDQEVMKKYLAYARKKCQPQLSDEAVEVILSYFTEMRKEIQGGALNITTRQLESLKRLTEARAKAELRDYASENDAIEVVKLYQESIYNMDAKGLGRVGVRGEKDLNLGEKSVAKQQKAYIERLQALISEKGSDVMTFQELHNVSKELGLRVGDFTFFVEKLNMANVLIKKGPGMYKVCVGYY